MLAAADAGSVDTEALKEKLDIPKKEVAEPVGIVDNNTLIKE